MPPASTPAGRLAGSFWPAIISKCLRPKWGGGIEATLALYLTPRCFWFCFMRHRYGAKVLPRRCRPAPGSQVVSGVARFVSSTIRWRWVVKVRSCKSGGSDLNAHLIEGGDACCRCTTSAGAGMERTSRRDNQPFGALTTPFFAGRRRPAFTGKAGWSIFCCKSS